MLFLRRANEQRSTLANRENDEHSNDVAQEGGARTWGALADTSRFFESQQQKLSGVDAFPLSETAFDTQSEDWVKRTRSRLQDFSL